MINVYSRMVEQVQTLFDISAEFVAGNVQVISVEPIGELPGTILSKLIDFLNAEDLNKLDEVFLENGVNTVPAWRSHLTKRWPHPYQHRSTVFRESAFVHPKQVYLEKHFHNCLRSLCYNDYLDPTTPMQKSLRDPVFFDIRPLRRESLEQNLIRHAEYAKKLIVKLSHCHFVLNHVELLKAMKGSVCVLEVYLGRSMSESSVDWLIRLSGLLRREGHLQELHLHLPEALRRNQWLLLVSIMRDCSAAQMLTQTRPGHSNICAATGPTLLEDLLLEDEEFYLGCDTGHNFDDKNTSTIDLEEDNLYNEAIVHTQRSQYAYVCQLEHTNVGQLEYADVGQSAHTDMGQLEHADVGQLVHTDMDQLEHTYVGHQKHTNVGQLECTDVGQVEHTIVSQLEHEDVGQLEHTDVGQLVHTIVGQLEHEDVGQLEHTDKGQLKDADMCQVEHTDLSLDGACGSLSVISKDGMSCLCDVSKMGARSEGRGLRGIALYNVNCYGEMGTDLAGLLRSWCGLERLAIHHFGPTDLAGTVSGRVVEGSEGFLCLCDVILTQLRAHKLTHLVLSECFSRGLHLTDLVNFFTTLLIIINNKYRVCDGSSILPPLQQLRIPIITDLKSPKLFQGVKLHSPVNAVVHLEVSLESGHDWVNLGEMAVQATALISSFIQFDQALRTLSIQDTSSFITMTGAQLSRLCQTISESGHLEELVLNIKVPGGVNVAVLDMVGECQSLRKLQLHQLTAESHTDGDQTDQCIAEKLAKVVQSHSQLKELVLKGGRSRSHAKFLMGFMTNLFSSGERMRLQCLDISDNFITADDLLTMVSGLDSSEGEGRYPVLETLTVMCHSSMQDDLELFSQLKRALDTLAFHVNLRMDDLGAGADYVAQM